MGRSVAVDFGRPYRIRIEESKKKLDASKKKMEEVDEFKYFGLVFFNDGSLEGETREGCLKEKGYCIPGKDDEGEDGEQGCKEGGA